MTPLAPTHSLADACERAQKLANSTGRNWVVYVSQDGLAFIQPATSQVPHQSRWREHSRYVPEN